MKCKYCPHDDFTHHNMSGKCEAVLTKYEGPMYTIEFPTGFKAWTQEIEYGIDCSCPGLYATEIADRKKPKRINLRIKYKPLDAWT